MSRLTKSTIGSFEYDLKDHNHISREFGTYDAFFNYSMAVKKLGEYEDICDNIEELQLKLNRLKHYDELEQQGRLAELPCKVGDTVYWCDPDIDGEPYIGEFKVIGITLREDGFFVVDGDGNIEKIGTQYALLTKAEAEQKLKEVTSNGN